MCQLSLKNVTVEVASESPIMCFILNSTQETKGAQIPSMEEEEEKDQGHKQGAFSEFVMRNFAALLSLMYPGAFTTYSVQVGFQENLSFG